MENNFMKYKTKNEKTFFDEEFRLEKLSDQKDPLVKLAEKIDFEMFRPMLEKSLAKEKIGHGGAKPYDYVMMFKILILQRYYNISDDKTEFSILDRLSFMRFLGLAMADKVPDAKTIWLFREKLIENNMIDELFSLFRNELENKNLIVNEGKIVDASFVDVPIQRNTRKENEQIKNGEIPNDWSENKLAKKDMDARWAQKNGDDFFGYKDHIKVDEKSKLIDKYIVTDASVHDSQAMEKLLSVRDQGQNIHADSAYSGGPVKEIIRKCRMKNRIHEKGYRNNPLTEKQNASNKFKSKIRSRVEHVFGFIQNSMNGSFIRTIGIKRATATIGLINLTYNMFRSIQIGYCSS